MRTTKKKPIIAMDISMSGQGGGPFVSTSRIMNSGLKEKYDFKIVYYKTDLGRGISIKRIRDLAEQIKTISPDIVHFTGLQLSGFHMVIACKIARIRNSLITIRGFSGDNIEFNPIKRIIMNLVIEPLTLILTKKIYCNSNFTGNRRLIRIFNRKNFGTIYNFPPDKDTSDFDIRKELNLNQKDLIVVTVARINKEKGYHILDEVIRKFDNNNRMKFLIIGDGEYLPTMKKNLSRQVTNRQVFFLGYRDDVQAILKGCDLFVLPTLHETLSLALLEASVAGLALIASNTGGIPEIIRDGHNGLLVKPANIDDLYNSIEYLADNLEKRKELSYNAQQDVKSKFSITLIENEIDNLYRMILRND